MRDMPGVKLTPEQHAFLREHNHLRSPVLAEAFRTRFNRHMSWMGVKMWRQRWRKKMNLTSHLPIKNHPEGHEIRHSGYIRIKVGGAWVVKQRILWMQAGNVIPDGWKLKCRTRDTFNPDPSNWVCVPSRVTRFLMMRGFADMPRELQDSAIAISMIEHQLVMRGGRIRKSKKNGQGK